jgi:hypothetical protein
VSNHAYSRKLSGMKLPGFNMQDQRKLFVGIILLVALFAFEVFNFDTTQFALQSLLGDVQFLGILWATILAIAFCSIDFAGLVRLFTPESASGANKEGWYLMGAWLLGATMNAVMTWWAVSLTLLNNNFGNEVLSREQLLRYVPIFVAVLVWLTRILFIGAFSIAGGQLFGNKSGRSNGRRQTTSVGSPTASQERPSSQPRLKAAPKPKPKPAMRPTPVEIHEDPDISQVPNTPPQPAMSQPTASSQRRSSRIRHRPPVPNRGLRKTGSSIQARSRS